MSNTNKAIVILAAPFAVCASWLAARVWFAIGALAFAVQMAIGKLVLIGLAAVLGAAFAQAAHAQGNAGFIYARGADGSYRQVYSEMYQDLTRFGNDLITLGHAYNGGVAAVLMSESGQDYIIYALTAQPNSNGEDLVHATLESRDAATGNVKPAMTQVFVGSFGGTFIGETAGSMFAGYYGGGFGGSPQKSPTGNEDQY
jgi:hypothetical protein